jgi:hypothetical protein
MLKYQIYGVLLFIILLILIYLINKNTLVIEKFGGPSDKYIKYENSYFNLNVAPFESTTLDQALEDCLTTPACLGITKDKIANNYRKIIKNDQCKSQYLGNDIQKSKSFGYETYIKKTVDNYDQLCLTRSSMEYPFIIETNNDLILCIQNKNLFALNKAVVREKKLLDLTQFNITPGLYGDDNGYISLKPMYEKYANYYVVHDYPRKDYLFLKEIDENNVNEKKKASFKITESLLKKGVSFKIVDFENIYVRIENSSLTSDNVILSQLINSSDQEAGTFYIKPGKNDESDLVESENQQKLKDDIQSLSDEEKFKLMKKNNINKLEIQKLNLEKQNRQIDDMNYYHLNNINFVGREFANQSADFALTKFLTEKEAIQKLAQQTPSPDKMRLMPTPTPTATDTTTANSK